MIGLTNGVEFGEGGAAPEQGWRALVGSLAGDDPQSVLEVAENGENHAVGEYERALRRDDLPEDLRPVIAAQAEKVRTTQDELKTLRDQAQ